MKVLPKKMVKFGLLVVPLLISAAVIACGASAESLEHGTDEHDSTMQTHMDSDHNDVVPEEDEAEHTNNHGESVVDPDAPIIHVIAKEFGFTPVDLEVKAGHAFTIMLHNEGVLEHDIAIEGLEELGGIHLLAGKDGMASFVLAEPGDYTYYCTVPGHREAGMLGTLIVEADDHGSADVQDESREDGEEHAQK